MNMDNKNAIAWGVTGGGDQLVETTEIMKQMKKKYKNQINIEVFLSEAGKQVLKFYQLLNEIEEAFDNLWSEKNANSPFLAGRIQMNDFLFLLIAPATSNTVAKIAHGISDSMLTNAAIQSLKVSKPVYILPTDYREGIMTTVLPSGKELKLRIRKEDVENVKKLDQMENIQTFGEASIIKGIFKKYFE
jgi:archaeoflavoprotein AfpA